LVRGALIFFSYSLCDLKSMLMYLVDVVILIKKLITIPVDRL